MGGGVGLSPLPLSFGGSDGPVTGASKTRFTRIPVADVMADPMGKWCFFFLRLTLAGHSGSKGLNNYNCKMAAEAIYLRINEILKLYIR